MAKINILHYFFSWQRGLYKVFKKTFKMKRLHEWMENSFESLFKFPKTAPPLGIYYQITSSGDSRHKCGKFIYAKCEFRRKEEEE